MKGTSIKKKEFRVQNLDCEHDAAAIQRGLSKVAGLVSLEILPKSAKVILSYDEDRISYEQIKRKLEEIGFPVQEGFAIPSQPKWWRNPKVVASMVSGVLLVLGFILQVLGAQEVLVTGVSILAVLIGGYYFGKEAFETLIYEHKVGIELLMSVAAIVAFVMGEALESAMLVFLYSISEAAEGYTEEKTRSAVRALMKLSPKTAVVIRDGVEQEIPAEALKEGELFLVKPGGSIVTDGVILTGTSSLNQAPITGESMPVEKKEGDTVYAGSINGEGTLQVRAIRAFADNTINRIIRMVEEAQERKGESQRFIERFGDRYSPVVLIAGILTAVVPPLLFGAPWDTWILRATVFIVAAAPCALVISIPITLVATLGTAARNGVLIKGGIFVEKLSGILTVAMDKTGTLTKGKPEVTDINFWSAGDKDKYTVEDVLRLAAGIEKWSEHPLAKAIVDYAREKEIGFTEVEQFQSLPGAGAKAIIAGKTIWIGSPAYFSGELHFDHVIDNRTIQQLQDQGKTVVLVGDQEEIVGYIAIRDQIRPDASEAVRLLHQKGVKHVVMLTGDNERSAQEIAAELGVDAFYADLMPADKVTKIQELVRDYGEVAMVGDGVNDAPALAEATVGIAMGAIGTDVALETADVALMGDDLKKIAYALQLSRRNQSIVRQNLVFSAVVISALVIGAIGGWFTLPLAVIGHELSEFIVIGNGMRMLKS